MPLFPGQNDPGIPGAALDYQPSSNLPQYHTHSAKFPIVREVILSNVDKNSKFPILQELRKKPKKTLIAPDAPSKQMAAWTQVQMQTQILPDQTHPGLTQSLAQPPEASAYRQPYNVPSDIYSNTTPKQNMWESSNSPYLPKPQEDHNPQTSLQVTSSAKVDQDNAKSRGVTKTYHAIKDIISGKFKGKEDGKGEKTSLNNSMQELRRAPGLDEENKTKTQNLQDYNQNPNQHQYNQHILQQQMIMQQTQQQSQQLPPKPRSPHQYSQLMQARSQEMLATRYEEQMNYQGYGNGAVMRTSNRGMQDQQNNIDQRFRQVPNNRPMPIGNEIPKDRHAALAAFERRSAQQLERDNLRRSSFEARRTASHPQLLLDDDIRGNNMASGFQQQEPPSYPRRGSQSNLIEAAFHPNSRPENEPESDDGGFLKRTEMKEQGLERGPVNQKLTANISGGKITEALQGNSRKKLEVEIGKIEGVYNVNHRVTYGCEHLTDSPHTTANSVNKIGNGSSAASSDYDRAGERASSNIDSGRGSAAYSSGRRLPNEDLQNTDADLPHEQIKPYGDLSNQEQDSEWVDIVEHELRHILEPKLQELSLQNNNPAIANSTVSESISSMTPPLPPLSVAEHSSPTMTPRNMSHYKHSSLQYGSKLDYDKGNTSKSRYLDSSQKYKPSRKMDPNTILRGKQIFGLDNTDLTSTTTRSLDLESMLEGQTDSDGDLSMADAKAIRKQLEGLETMYSEVLKLLGVNKRGGKYQPSDPKCNKRRYGSMSSLVSSSVSSIRRERRSTRGLPEDRRRGREQPRATARRFQRLEAHVVTLARSVAHLSSEMRTQHLVTQEMEAVRQEVAALRAQTNMLNIRSQSALRPTSNRDLPSLANPIRVKKLTKFFGDEPPLLRLFLRKLGYEKYATVFENEKIGMIELPYLTEDRLQKMGIPLGPRLRIMQEAQISVCKENTLCIV
ncbi:uncharacterized protein LOC143194417 isoform X1 [Rhynchophorus ferrugineus]|uniref:uncharacterized protein LOC143194417 isoform X1 n=1 Tax=Rhynchophorus ferrugineus TaxID=354439 RepID=UPI003FCE65A5